MTGPLPFCTTLSFGSSAGAGAVALCVCSWAGIARPVIMTVAPTTALLIRKVRRSTPGGTACEINSTGLSSGSLMLDSRDRPVELTVSSNVSLSFSDMMRLLNFHLNSDQAGIRLQKVAGPTLRDPAHRGVQVPLSLQTPCTSKSLITAANLSSDALVNHQSDFHASVLSPTGLRRVFRNRFQLPIAKRLDQTV